MMTPSAVMRHLVVTVTSWWTDASHPLATIEIVLVAVLYFGLTCNQTNDFGLHCKSTLFFFFFWKSAVRLSYNNRNPALGVLWSWHRVASPPIEIPIQICFLSGNFDLWSHPSMDHKETYLLSIPTFFVSFEDACVKKIILFKWGLKFESTGLPSWLLNLAVTWSVFFFWENYPYVRKTS